MSEKYITHLYEAMNALMSGYMPGMKDAGSVYIVNYMQNNAFAQALTTDYKLRNGITVDPEDKKLKLMTNDESDYGFANSTDIKGVYRVLDKAHLSEGLEMLKSNIGKEVPIGFIYECILGDKLYTWDQIEFSDKVEKIVPYNTLIKNMNESLRQYIYDECKVDYIIKESGKNSSKEIQDINNKIHNCITDEFIWYFIHIYTTYNPTILKLPTTYIEVVGFKEKIDPKYKSHNLGAIVLYNKDICKVLIDNIEIKRRININYDLDEDLIKYTKWNSIFKK